MTDSDRDDVPPGPQRTWKERAYDQNERAGRLREQVEDLTAQLARQASELVSATTTALACQKECRAVRDAAALPVNAPLEDVLRVLRNAAQPDAALSTPVVTVAAIKSELLREQAARKSAESALDGLIARLRVLVPDLRSDAPWDNVVSKVAASMRNLEQANMLQREALEVIARTVGTHRQDRPTSLQETIDRVADFCGPARDASLESDPWERVAAMFEGADMEPVRVWLESLAEAMRNVEHTMRNKPDPVAAMQKVAKSVKDLLDGVVTRP